MFYNQEFAAGSDNLFYGIYVATLFNLNVRVDLGDLSTMVDGAQTGTGTSSTCQWRIRVWDNGPPQVKLSDTTIDIDHSTTTCINVPTGVLATGIEGPTGCTGSLTIEDVTMARLPFVETVDTMTFNDKRDPRYDLTCRGDGVGTGTGTGPYEHGRAPSDCQPEFINLCGECSPDYTTLTGLSVSGVLYLVDTTENDRPTFVNGSRVLYWTTAHWSIRESGAEVAVGPPFPDCPIGLYHWTNSGTGTGTGTGTGNLAGSYFCVTDSSDTIPRIHCGPCGQVCSRLCVTGPRHYDPGYDETSPYKDRATFIWFEDWDSDLLLARGWRYYNPETELTEYIYLGDAGTLDVDGQLFYRDFGSHSFGDQTKPYWIGTLTGGYTNASYVYSDGTNWRIMIGGNPVATGPLDTEDPYGDYPSTSGPLHPHTYAVSAPAEASVCTLTFKFETGLTEEIYTPAVIPHTLDWAHPYDVPAQSYFPFAGGCSCKLAVFHISTSHPTHGLAVRCGFCSCWDFYCGSCRCVPTQLCVAYYDGYNWHLNVFLDWDDEQKAWVGSGWEEPSTGSGTGTSDTEELTVFLRRNDLGQCEIAPDFEPGPNQVYPTWNCGEGHITRKFDTLEDIVSFSYANYRDPLHPIFVYGSSHVPTCVRSNCTHATPCNADCGGHPDRIYMTIQQYRLAGDTPETPPEEYAERTFVLVYEESADWYVPQDPVEDSYIQVMCRYRGVIQSSCAGFDYCPVLVEVWDGHVRMQGTSGSGCITLTPGSDIEYLPLTESCDPYYAETAEVYTTGGLWAGTCLGLSTGTTRFKIILTE